MFFLLKPFQYALQPAEHEREFLVNRLSSDKRALARIFWLALLIIVTFGVLGLMLVPPSDRRMIMGLARLVGVAVLVVGLFSLPRLGTKQQLDWLAFGCLGWVVTQVQFGHYLSIGSLEAMVAWDIFVIFILYLAVPVSLRFQVVLALILSLASVSIWALRKGDSITEVEYIGVVSVYLAVNVFGLICSVHAARAAREEFEHLSNEKALKRNLESALARLETTARSRNQIFRILAHDLRGTIGGLETIGKLLSEEDEQSEDERQDLIDLLCDSSKSSYNLLEDLLQWALTENGGAETKFENTQLSAVVSSNFEFLEVVAHNKNIELRADIEDSIEVSADPKMLNTIVRNLISNAIKFTPAFGLVFVTGKVREDGFVEVSVRDTGVGIDKERLSRLFSLSPGKSSLGTAGESGTNLGLRICSDFVQRQGGSISVASDVGVGSCFTFTLPMSRQLA